MAYLNVFNNDLQLMARYGKACDKKAYSDLNYVGHKTIHIDPPPLPDRVNRNM